METCWCCRADFINVGSSQIRLNLSYILLLRCSLNTIVHAAKPGPWAGTQKCTVLTIQHNGESQTTFSHCPQGLRSSESWESKWEITMYKKACTAFLNSMCSNFHLHTLIPAEVLLPHSPAAPSSSSVRHNDSLMTKLRYLGGTRRKGHFLPIRWQLGYLSDVTVFMIRELSDAEWWPLKCSLQSCDWSLL